MSSARVKRKLNGLESARKRYRRAMRELNMVRRAAMLAEALAAMARLAGEKGEEATPPQPSPICDEAAN